MRVELDLAHSLALKYLMEERQRLERKMRDNMSAAAALLEGATGLQNPLVREIQELESSRLALVLETTESTADEDHESDASEAPEEPRVPEESESES